ncbi:MAG: hypothetical protein WB473_16105 [Pedococcus sp.]
MSDPTSTNRTDDTDRTQHVPTEPTQQVPTTDPTRQVPTTDPTRQVPLTAPTQQLPVGDGAATEPREPVETTFFGAASPEETSTTRAAATESTSEARPSAAPTAGAWPPPVPPRPTGPHAPAILLGLVALAVAGIVLAQELGNLTVDWGNVGPLGFVAVGAVLVVLGAVGLISSNRRSSKA